MFGRLHGPSAAASSTYHVLVHARGYIKREMVLRYDLSANENNLFCPVYSYSIYSGMAGDGGGGDGGGGNVQR